MTSSCPSTWLKEGSLSPLPTDTTRRRRSEAGGEGRTLRGVGAANGTLVAFAGRTPCAGVNLESLSWAEEAGEMEENGGLRTKDCCLLLAPGSLKSKSIGGYCCAIELD